jgi:hypothetical protein
MGSMIMGTKGAIGKPLEGAQVHVERENRPVCRRETGRIHTYTGVAENKRGPHKKRRTKKEACTEEMRTMARSDLFSCMAGFTRSTRWSYHFLTCHIPMVMR